MSATLPATYNFNVPQPISTDIALYGGVFAKRHVIPQAGTYVPQHSHGYDHLSLLTVGRLRAWCDGALLGDYVAPAEIRIPAHSSHTFLALVDGTTFYCLHNAEHFEEEEHGELPGAPCADCTACAPGKLKSGTPDRGDGIVFAREDLDVFLAEDGTLFAAHCLSVGEAPDEWLEKNWTVMRRLQVQGGLHLTTARRRGVLLGYVMAITSPALNDIHATEGLHTLFYSSPDVPGLGLRLQRASIEYLRDLGVDHVVLRAGHRGNGPRLEALYRRLGATPCGNLFMLKLGDAG